jgi:hypothetical protein
MFYCRNSGRHRDHAKLPPRPNLHLSPRKKARPSPARRSIFSSRASFKLSLFPSLAQPARL